MCFLSQHTSGSHTSDEHGKEEGDQSEEGTLIVGGGLHGLAAIHPGFAAERLGVDRRLLVNRKRELKMYRVWMQGKFRRLAGPAGAGKGAQ